MLSDAFPMAAEMLQNDIAASDSGDGTERSTDSTRSVSPMAPFELSLDPSDPLAFLMNSTAELHSNDSSTDDSYASSATSPSSRESPTVDWTSTTQESDKKDNTSAADMAWPIDMQQLLLNSLTSGMAPAYVTGGMPIAVQQNMPLAFSDPYFFGMPQTFNAFGQQPFMGFNGAFPQQFAFAGEGPKPPVAIQPDSNVQSPTSSTQGRRLSITSSSSSSGVSLSPIMDNAQPPTPATASHTQSPTQKDPVSDLIARAHQAAGIVPAASVAAAASQPSQPAKLPIPRLQRSPTTPAPLAKRKSESPSTPTEPNESSPPTRTSTGRTKTSHTTIERRYRTNLNARIQSLRAAVPALRVLEQKDGNRVGNLALKAGTRKGEANGDCEGIDVVDERGFVDGVKVARKGSKANVLGKAVEYIRVLKRRELRLKREQDGLRALISSLDNGPALLKAWETMWGEKYGGPETDEVEGEEENEADDENDDGDEDDEGDDDDEETGKKRKRIKVEGGGKGKSKPVTPPAAQQEKRKRGRPRKVPLPIPMSTIPNETIILDTEMTNVADVLNGATMPTFQQIQPQRQYLLAAFAFFSFFNSPVSYYTSRGHTGSGFHSAHPAEHTHTGTVLGAHSQGHTTLEWSHPQIAHGFGWRDVVEFLHIAVSLLLLVSIVTPWLPRVLRVPVTRVIPKALRPLLGDAFFQLQLQDEAGTTQPPHSPTQDRKDERLDAALDASIRVTPQRGARILFDAMDLQPGVWGILKSLRRSVAGEVKGLERKVQEQAVVLKIAELVALDASASFTTRLHAALLTSTHLTMRSAQPADLATLALIIRPIWRSKASTLWALASERSDDNLHICRPYAKLVLDKMTVDEAAESLGHALAAGRYVDEVTIASEGPGAEGTLSPLEILARDIVLEGIRNEAEKVFMRDVLGEGVDVESIENKDEVEDETTTTKTTSRTQERITPAVINAGHSLGGRTAKLVTLYEDVCVNRDANAATLDEFDDESGAREGILGDITSLIRAIALYRLLFASSGPLSRVPSFSLLSSASTHTSTRPDSPTTPKASYTSLKPTSIPSSSRTGGRMSIPSPPPSPPLFKPSAQKLALRRCLDSAAFDRWPLLEDARDRVVDLVTA